MNIGVKVKVLKKKGFTPNLELMKSVFWLVYSIMYKNML